MRWIILSMMALNFLSGPAFSVDLSYFRVSQKAELESEASRQILEYRKLTGISSPTLPADSVTLPALREYRRFSSSFFREILNPAVQTLVQHKKWGEHPVLDPSKFEDELEAERKAADQIILDSVMKKDFKLLVGQLRALASQSTNSSERSQGDPQEAALGSKLFDYILQSQPSLNWETERGMNKETKALRIEKILKELKSVEVYGGFPLRLIFQTETSGLLPVSLSSLISVRAGVDSYFVRTLELLSDKLLSEQNPFLDPKTRQVRKLDSNEANYLADLREAKKFVDEKLEGARKSNAVLMFLAKTQLDFLIDLMIQLRGRDIPLDREISQLDGVIYQLQNSADGAQFKESDPRLAAYLFYRDLQSQLEYYRMTLESEAKAKKVIIPIVEKIKSGLKR